jgi:transcriptional regulator with XRE-family HTH domain
MGERLRAARASRRLTQAQVADRLGVTQAYVSMLEQGRRTIPDPLKANVAQIYGLGPTALPVVPETASWTNAEVAAALASLGYRPFSYLRGRRRRNPASVLLGALRLTNLEARAAEALPWVLLAYPDLDWDWLTQEAKLADVQNRLGFVVTLARQVAERKGDTALADKLRPRESVLERSRLAREDTFAQDSLTQAERRWLRQNRGPEAEHWNLLTGHRADQLRHVE